MTAPLHLIHPFISQFYQLPHQYFSFDNFTHMNGHQILKDTGRTDNFCAASTTVAITAALCPSKDLQAPSCGHEAVLFLKSNVESCFFHQGKIVQM